MAKKRKAKKNIKSKNKIKIKNVTVAPPAPVEVSKPVQTKTENQTFAEFGTKNIIKYKYWYLGISALIIIPGLIFLGLFGLKMSIDFTGGSVLKFSATESVLNETVVNQAVAGRTEIESIVFEDGNKTALVRTKSIESKTNEQIKLAFSEISPDVLETSFETVGPSIGAETGRKSLLAFGIACAGIVLYIAYAFRNVPKPFSGFRFGVSAVIAMIHDACVVLGVFAILGHFEGVEVDPMFITALLTIIGFSVHDTIVVFDRVRENLGRYKGKDIEWIANYSLLETMRRSIATSATVVITLTALFIFGGVSIKWFVLALLVGVVSGTYSSIFNATPILVIWENYLHRKSKK